MEASIALITMCIVLVAVLIFAYLTITKLLKKLDDVILASIAKSADEYVAIKDYSEKPKTQTIESDVDETLEIDKMNTEEFQKHIQLVNNNG